MSGISQEFINNISYLYEEINTQQNNVLNEDSEYYDENISEIVEDVLSTISICMVHEGYSAEGIISFLADSSDEIILEKYLSFDQNILTESEVSEDYIIEQLELFDCVIGEGLGSVLGKITKGTVGLAKRIATKPTRTKVSNIIQKSKRPEVARRRIQNIAQREARKGKVSGYSQTQSPIGGKTLSGKESAELLKKAKFGQAIQKVKDIAGKAKSVLTGPKAKKIGLGALGTGALIGLPYLGAKLALSGSLPPTATTSPGRSPKDDFLQGSTLAKLGGREGRVKGGEFRTIKWTPESRAKYNALVKGSSESKPSKPSSSGTGGLTSINQQKGTITSGGRTAKLSSTQLVRDPKTGKQVIGDLAYRGGKPVYLARPSIASRDTNLFSRLSRATGIGGQRERDVSAAKREYRTALRNTQRFQSGMGLTPQKAKALGLPGR